MGKVLVEGSKVTCGAAPPPSPHQGVIKLKGAPRLVVDGSPVLTTASIPTPDTPDAFAGCSNPPNALGPCTKVVKPITGASTRLAVDGAFVLLYSLQAKTHPAQSPIHVDSKFINNDRLEAD
jgi:hypothetical protein